MKKSSQMLIMVLLLLVVVIPQAHAITSSLSGVSLPAADPIDTLLTQYRNIAEFWSNRMIAYASWLFWGLVVISMVWTYGLLALRQADIQEFLSETIQFLATIGFFWWILINGPQIAVSIIDTLRQIAADATGLHSQALTPADFMGIGLEIVETAVNNASIWSPVNSALRIIIAAIIFIMLILIALNIVLLLIAGWILCYGGVFLLGFGGGRWTSDIAISYYKTVLNLGIQFFAMTLIVGIGKSFMDKAVVNNGESIEELLIILGSAIIFFSLVNKVPPMFVSIVQISGGGNVTGIGGNSSASSVISAAVQTAVAIKTGGATALKAGAASSLFKGKGK